MAKTETVHTRVTRDIKERADFLFSKLGLTTSQAIMLFLTAAVNKNGFPFELSLSSIREFGLINNEQLAYLINLTGGKEPSARAKKIIHLYATKEIDYETAKFVLMRMYKH